MTKNEEKIEKKTIRIYGVPETTDGLLHSHEIRVFEDGKYVERLQSIEVNITAGTVPLIKMVSLPFGIDVQLEGVEIDHEITALRIFNELKEVLKLMDYDFQRAWRDGKKDSWKTATPKELKEGVDKMYEYLNTVFREVASGERSEVDVALFAIKLANYSMLLADRVDRMLKEKK